MIGKTLSHYKVIEKIGEGGMAVVYMAEQKLPVRRKVALKIIKLGMDTKEVIARFEAERQALALMDHPHIAKVFDAGTTDFGLGASLGYGLMENVWLSFGYNFHGFDDSDFSQGDFTAQGPFVKFRVKFDQEDFRSLLK